MDLYQAGYTRRGRQGEGSGWSLVSESEGMSQKAKDGFAGFAGNLAELVQSIDMPEEAIGMFYDDRFLYYLHINYKTEAEGGDNRGISFTHGYCFNLMDYYTLCKNPEKLFGIKEEVFLKNYDSNVVSYPMMEDFSYHNMNLEYLKEKYQLSRELYRRLLIGATCAIEGYTDSLCIKMNCAKEEYAQVCKEVMYLIMQGLPYHLRIKVTFFSYRGGKTSIYFSDQIEGTNYFDLDTKEYACDKSRLEKYRFTLMYNLPEDNMRLEMYKSIAEFMEESFDVPLKDMDCEEIEHGFLAKSKNELSKGEWKDLAIQILTSFLSMPLKESNATEEYIADLLDIITNYVLLVEDEKLLNNITNRAQRSANTTLQNSYLRFYARQILVRNVTDGYEALWKYYQKDKEQYFQILNEIKYMNEIFYLNYYKGVFLPRRLTDMNSIISYLLEEKKDITSNIAGRFDELLKSITRKELQKSCNFLEMFEVHEKAMKIADSLAPNYAERYIESTDYQIWEHFNLESFNPEEAKLYEMCSLNKLLGKECIGRGYRVMKVVNELIEVLEDTGRNSYKENIYTLIFKDDILDNPDTKKILMKTIRKYDLPKIECITERNFDFVVICHYDEIRRNFDIVKLVKFIHKKNCEHIFNIHGFRQIQNHSEIINDRKFKTILSNELMKVMEENKENRIMDKEILQSVKRFYSYLTNQELIEETEIEEEKNVAFCIHKIAVGYLALFSFGFFLLCLNQYANISFMLTAGIGGLAGIMVLLVFMLKIYKNGGFEKALEASGITSIQELMLGIGFGGVLSIVSLVIGLLLWKLPVLQEGPTFMKTVVIAITAVVYILIAIVAAVLNSIKEE